MSTSIGRPTSRSTICSTRTRRPSIRTPRIRPTTAPIRCCMTPSAACSMWGCASTIRRIAWRAYAVWTSGARCGPLRLYKNRHSRQEIRMNKFGLLLLPALLATVAAVAQPAENPHIVAPTPTPGLHAPDAPALPYHFAQRPQAPYGQKFGNIASVALTPQGHLLVFNRNPQIMMVEYDGNGKFLRSFNPNIAVNSHGMRV